MSFLSKGLSDNISFLIVFRKYNLLQQTSNFSGFVWYVWYIPYFFDYKMEFFPVLCIGLRMTYEKVTLTGKENTIKILAKLYESTTSHSRPALNPLSYWGSSENLPIRVCKVSCL